jgi:hypothetical protein
MAVERTPEPFNIEDSIGDDPEELEIEIVNPEAVAITDEDGGVLIDFGGEISDELMGGAHDDNLAEQIDDDTLMSMSNELLADFESDKQARRDWATSYANGLDLLGLKIEERSMPWEGASGVFHPLLTEAVVRFQAQAMGELFPASGPARTKIMGKATPDKVKQATRVENELNYQLTENMVEYRDELEQMLFQLPLAGSAFKKVYFDPIMERPASVFVPAEDFVVPYGASDLQTCERYTHVMKKTTVEVMKLQLNGFYRDVDLPEPEPDFSDIQEKYNKLAGEEGTVEDDDRHTILEMHVTMNMPEEMDDPDGIPRPYIVTIEKSSGIVLSIRRNWFEDDARKIKRMHFTHYKYLPGMGFYGIGLIHLIGGLAKSATSILRQLVDAGTLANIPAGLKAKGMRITGDNTPLQPGEWRDVDVPGGTLRESLFPLPYKEPSTVLYQLLGNVVEEGRRIGSIADIQVGNMNPEAPVGTTLALLERSMKVMTGVQARLHAAMRRELKLIAEVIRDFMGPRYAYDDEAEHDRMADFDGRVDVIPVSDPNAATMAQRVVQYQAALQLAQQAPQLYDMGKLHRGMLEVLNIQDADEIIKLPDDIKPMDPVTENMAMLKQEPVKAFEYQDHEAHIAVHMAAMKDPKIQQLVGQSPFAAAISSAAAAHITEHVAMAYRVEIQKQLGVELPAADAELPEDVEREISRLAAAAAEKLLGKNQAEAAQMAAKQAEKDPLTQIQRAELQIKERDMALKEAEAKHKALLDMEKLKLDAQKTGANIALSEERLDAEMQRDAANTAIRAAVQLDASARKERDKGAEIGLRAAEMALDRASQSNGGGTDGAA